MATVAEPPAPVRRTNMSGLYPLTTKRSLLLRIVTSAIKGAANKYTAMARNNQFANESQGEGKIDMCPRATTGATHAQNKGVASRMRHCSRRADLLIANHRISNIDPLFQLPNVGHHREPDLSAIRCMPLLAVLFLSVLFALS